MTIKTQSLLIILFTATFLLISNAIALKFSLYYITWWADTLNHFVAGFLFAFMVSYLICFYGKKYKYAQNQKTLLVLFSVFFVGIVWEIFEAKAGLTFVDKEGYWSDTFGDIFMDLLGALVGFLHFNSLNGK